MSEATILNGINVEAFQDALKTVGAQPAAAHAPKSSRVRWLDGLRFKAYARNHTFTVDEPAHLTGDDLAPNSMEYVLGAYGACLATGFVVNATKRGISVRNLEVSVSSTQDNAFTFLGLSDEGHPGFDQVTAKLYVQADADEKTIQELWEHSIKTSPVANSLSRTVPLKCEVEIIP